MVSETTSPNVYISDHLPRLYPELYAALRATLGQALLMISGTKDVWCRDYMPIEVSPGRFVQFTYDPDYLIGFNHLRTVQAGHLLNLPRLKPSPIVLDGGNVVGWERTAIVTGKVHYDNRDLRPHQVKESLEELLQIDRLIVIPWDRHDVLGHADGVVRLVSEQTALMSDYRKVDRAYHKEVLRTLRRHRVDVLPVPFLPTKVTLPGIGSAEGCYLNFLVTPDHLIVPGFGRSEDAAAASTIEKHYGMAATIIHVSQLAREGGALRCATWQSTVAVS